VIITTTTITIKMAYSFGEDEIEMLSSILAGAGITGFAPDEIINLISEFNSVLGRLFEETPALYAVFCSECSSHCSTKYHREGLAIHLLSVAIIARIYARTIYENAGLSDVMTISDFEKISYLAGLFHDIGKPLCRNEMKKYTLYTGHAQIGARLIEQLFESDVGSNMEIIWAINNHMCSCTHMHDIDQNIGRCFDHSLISLPKESNPRVAFALLAVLSYADQIGRLSDDVEDKVPESVSRHSIQLYRTMYSLWEQKETGSGLLPDTPHNGKIIVQLYGLSGSGKTYVANYLKAVFGKMYDIIHVERDNCLYAVYREHFGSTDGMTYQQVYNRVYESSDMKGLVQKRWIQDLADALTTPLDRVGQIIIIDSVQPLFPQAWNGTLMALGEEALSVYESTTKVGYYSIPINMFGLDVASKTGMTTSLPLKGKDAGGLSWPSVYTEIEADKSKTKQADIVYGTGSISLLKSYIERYFEVQLAKIHSFVQDLDFKQDNLGKILNGIVSVYGLTNLEDICEKMIDLFLEKTKSDRRFIIWNVELRNGKIILVRFTYRDGFQMFNGTTRDYRGEGFLYDNETHRFWYLRPSLPVFPEMSSIHADPKAYPYLHGVWDHIPALSNALYRQIKLSVKERKSTRMCLVPKYDGSLFNMMFVDVRNKVYPVLMALIDGLGDKLPERSYYKVEFGENAGIFIFGSKGTIFSKDPVNQRIHNAILGSYDSIEEFLEIAHRYVCSANFNREKQIINLHFEAIDAIPTEELTVYYGRAWCPFFGLTIYDDETQKKEFKLPVGPYDPIGYGFKSVAEIFDWENSWDNVREIHRRNYERLLAGEEVIEPEGYVLHIFDDEEGVWIPIKFKYEIYYAAHKPESKHNLEMSLRLTSDPQYKTLCQRLAKFRAKPSVQEIFNLNISYVEQIKKILTDSVDTILSTRPGQRQIMKKDWAGYWKPSANCSELISIFQTLSAFLAEYYTQLGIQITDKLVFNFVMKIFDMLGVQKDLANLNGLEIDRLVELLQELVFH